MARALTLEDFGQNMPTAGLSDQPSVGGDARLEVYEDGYKAGWDDAVAANTKAQTQISADFAKTLQDLSFGYHEARVHVLKNISPLLTLMAEKLLPQMARDGFAQNVVEVAKGYADEAGNAPVEIVVNPENRPALEELLEAETHIPLRLVEETSLGPGQAFLRAGQQEHAIDLEQVETAIRDAVAGFLTDDTEMLKHG